MSIEPGGDFDGRVHEPVLVQIVDRGGFVKPGAGDHGRLRQRSQGVDCPPAIIELVPQIGSDGDDGRMKVLLHLIRSFDHLFPALTGPRNRFQVRVSLSPESINSLSN